MRIPLLALITVSSLMAKTIIHEATTATIHHAAHGHDFVAQRDCVDGKIREEWRVDGQIVDFETYTEKLVAAEAAERQEELATKRAEALKDAELSTSLKIKAAQKIARLTLKTLQKKLAQIRTCELEPHLQFSLTTIPSRSEYNRLVYQFIPDSISTIERDDIEYTALLMMTEELELSAKRLHELIQHTMQYRITHCDDTTTLKKLLEHLD